MRRLQVDIAIIHRGGRYLICQRLPDGPLPNLWEFPGGKREPGETPADCVRREVREELAIDVRAVEALPPFGHQYKHLWVDIQPHGCEHVSGEPQPLACQEVRWVEPAELGNYEFPAANKDLIQTLMTRPPPPW